MKTHKRPLKVEVELWKQAFEGSQKEFKKLKADYERDAADGVRAIEKLQFEIRKRDNVIEMLRRSKELLRMASVKMINLMDKTWEEDLDHRPEITGEAR